MGSASARLLIALALMVPSVVACRHALPAPFPEARSTLPIEVEDLVEARHRSRILRARMELLSSCAREHFLESALDSTETQERLHPLKREYFAVRGRLFAIAFLHASAIVEQIEDPAPPVLLIRASLAVLAGAELVRNFHAVAAVLSDSSECRLAWEAADPEAGIPAGSWAVSLQAYRNAGYRELLRDGMARLKRHRGLLEELTRTGDAQIVRLYPDGVEATLAAIEQEYVLLNAQLAEEDLGQDEREVRGLTETSRLLRADWIAVGSALRDAAIKDRGLIRGPLHARMQEAKREYLDQREALYRIVFKHASKLTRQDIPYPRTFRLRAVGIALLAGLALYENALTMQNHLLTIPGVRSLLNQGDPALGIPPGFWNDIEREFYRPEYRDLLEAGIRVIEDEQRTQNLSWVEEDPFLTFVSREIVASRIVPEIRGERPDIQMARVLRYLAERLYLLATGTLTWGEGLAAMGFGNLVGAIELRKGKLFGQPPWAEFVRERLQPGDLLVEKTPFRLTDKLIPGHFGHVAMYVGTEDQLRALGLLHHPWVNRHRAQIARGNTIVEALRSGTQLSSIERFLNVDDLAILRPKPDVLSSADVAEAVVRAFSHVGKRYDFAFDANTWETIVCSELAFHTYIHVRWPVHRLFHAYTIGPDDVAVFAGADTSRPFGLLTFIHDGHLVHDQFFALDGEALYNRLLGVDLTPPSR